MLEDVEVSRSFMKRMKSTGEMHFHDVRIQSTLSNSNRLGDRKVRNTKFSNYRDSN